MNFNWKLAIANAAAIYFLAWMEAGIAVPLAILAALFVCDYSV
jgi:hypothetical protein